MIKHYLSHLVFAAQRMDMSIDAEEFTDKVKSSFLRRAELAKVRYEIVAVEQLIDEYKPSLSSSQYKRLMSIVHRMYEKLEEKSKKIDL